MNAKTWGPLAAAIVMGLFAAKLGRDMLARRSPEKAVAASVSRIAVAKDDIPAGATLKAIDISLKTVQEKDALPGTFHAADELIGRVTSVVLRKDRPIFDDSLAPIGSGSGLTAIVPDGMRAVTVDVNEVSGVAGLLVPGCRIDMVTTLSGEDGQMLARTIARDLLIIAVGRKFVSGKDELAPPDAPAARTVTLLVTPKEAEIIDLAAHTGNPRLLLRGSRDSHTSPGSDGVTVGELRSGTTDRGWLSSIEHMFDPVAKAIAKLPPPTQAVMAAAAPATQPVKPQRQVTVIRRTQEAAIAVEAIPEIKNQAVVDTDQSEVPGTNKH